MRAQADQLRQLTESLPNLVWSCRPDGVCDYLSRQWVEYTGVSEAEQLGYGWLEQAHPDDRERFREEWRAAIKSGTSFNSELRICGANGQYRWFKLRSAPIRDAKNAILKWYGTSTDIDDLKHAEEAQRQSLQRLTAVLEGISDGFFALDSTLAVTFVIRAAAHMLGRSENDLVGTPLLEVLPELRGTMAEQKLREVSATQTPLFFDAQLDHVQANGTYRMRVYAQQEPEGLSIFFERKARPEPAIVDNEKER